VRRLRLPLDPMLASETTLPVIASDRTRGTRGGL